MPFSDEDIIAFLLGEADPLLVSQIKECMQNDSQLVDRVGHFRLLLNHTNGSGQCFEPPSGLVEATLQRMDGSESDILEPTSNLDLVPTQSLVESQPSFSQIRSDRITSARRGLLSIVQEWGHANQFQNAFDSLALTIGLICLSCVILPAILRVRFESRRAQCSQNLLLNGKALFCFAIRNSDNRLPAVPSTGPESFAGIYSVRLAGAGLIDSASQLRCVSLLGIERPMVCEQIEFPTIDEIRKANQSQLAEWKMQLGGDYAYTLGIFERLRVVAPKNTGSSHFAILADAPLSIGGVESWSAHDGKGANILYDDGHVAFLTHSKLDSGRLVGDHPFWNRFGFREAGLDSSDASLAPSPFPPLDH